MDNFYIGGVFVTIGYGQKKGKTKAPTHTSFLVLDSFLQIFGLQFGITIFDLDDY